MSSKLIAADVQYIDPVDADSTVGFRIVHDNYGTDEKPELHLSARVSLTDCNRKIEWYFGKDDMAKLDRAIIVLKNFKALYAKEIKKIKEKKS